jgi:hypothetical protein
MTNYDPIEGYQLVFRYNREVFTPGVEGEMPHRSIVSFEDGYYSDYDPVSPGGSFEPDHLAAVDHPESDTLVIAIIPSLVGDDPWTEVPPGFDRLVFWILGTISPDAEPGTEVLLEPIEDYEPEGFGPEGLRNEITHRGGARYVGVYPRVRSSIGRIIPDIMIFRGDSNNDGSIDVSDAIYTLSWKFTGGPQPPYLDAADANDDGRVDLSDAVSILQTLFLGAHGIAGPYPHCGIDDRRGDSLKNRAVDMRRCGGP